jgi:hypothetical protein
MPEEEEATSAAAGADLLKHRRSRGGEGDTQRKD